MITTEQVIDYLTGKASADVKNCLDQSWTQDEFGYPTLNVNEANTKLALLEEEQKCASDLQLSRHNLGNREHR